MTEEAHGDKAWALCVGPENNANSASASDSNSSGSSPLRVATGGADSCIRIWEDCSQVVDESRKKREVIYRNITQHNIT